MSVHGDGQGSTWTGMETLDVDQPEGLDYREFQHLAKAIRKRSDKEHVNYDDATVGGEHVPGGCAVLGWEDATADITTGFNDGTYIGRGLIWDESKGFCCFTGDGTPSDLTLNYMRIGLEGIKADATFNWTGEMQFDASVVITQPVELSSVVIEGTTDISSANFDGTVDFGDVVIFAGNAGFAGDISSDGTTVLTNTVWEGSDLTVTFTPAGGTAGVIFKIFGDWSSRSLDTTYTAQTDGYVTGNIRDATQVTAHTPYGTSRGRYEMSAPNVTNINFMVKAGDTWAVVCDPTTGANAFCYWLPIGDNT